MDLEDAALFIKLVDAGSFTDVGEKLKIPKSTVSRRITQLEKQVGVRLLQRSTRNLRLTDEGKAFYDYFLKLTGNTAEFIESLHDKNIEPAGRVRLAIPVELALTTFSVLLSEFIGSNTEIELDVLLDVRQDAGSRHLDLLKENIDLAIVIADPGENYLVARKLGASYLRLYASPRYLKQHGEPQNIEQLRDHRLLYIEALEETALWQRLFEDSPKSSRSMRSNNVVMLRSAAQQHLGIATIPPWLCTDQLQAGELVPVLREELGNAEIFLVYPDRFLPRRTRLLVDFLIHNVKRLPWNDEEYRSSADG